MLSKKDVTGKSGNQLYNKIGQISGDSEMDNTSPYDVYEYTGRYR